VSLSNRYKAVFCPFGAFGRFPCFTSLLCLPCRAFVPVSLSTRVASLSRGAVSVSGVSVSWPRGCPFLCLPRLPRVGVGCRVLVAPSGLVCQGPDLEQVFDKPIRTSVSNKCSKEKTATFFGYSCQNFQPNLTEFGPNLNFQSNRILTESRNLCRCLPNRIRTESKSKTKVFLFC